MTGLNDEDRYKEYWGYLRHIETLRFTMGGLIVTVVSALLAVLHLAPGGGTVEHVGPWALIFLALFVGMAAWFLVAHNKSYAHYFKQLRSMDDRIKDFGKRGPFEALLALVTLLQFAVVGSAFSFDWLAGWESVLVVVIGVLALLVPWLYHQRTDGPDGDPT